MHPKLGLSSYAYYWATSAASVDGAIARSPWDLLDRVAALGLEVVQLCEHVPLSDWDATSLERLRDAALRQGIMLEVGARGLGLDDLRASLEVARALGARLWRLAPWSGSPTRQNLPIDRLHEVVDQLLPFCRRHDITLAIENYFDLPAQQLASFMLRVHDERVGVCLDTANSTGFLERPLETAEILAPYVVSMHLKDFVVTKPTQGYRISGAPLGQGWLDAPAVLDILACTGRPFTVLLELWVDRAETHEATVRREDDWVRQSVAYARDRLGIGRDHEIAR